MFTECQLQPPLGGSSHPLEEGAGAILRVSHLFSFILDKSLEGTVPLLTQMGATGWEELKEHKFRSDVLSCTVPGGYQAEVCHHSLYTRMVWGYPLPTTSFPQNNLSHLLLFLSLCSSLGQAGISHFSKITCMNTLFPSLLIMVLFIQTFQTFLF